MPVHVSAYSVHDVHYTYSCKYLIGPKRHTKETAVLGRLLMTPIKTLPIPITNCTRGSIGYANAGDISFVYANVSGRDFSCHGTAHKLVQ